MVGFAVSFSSPLAYQPNMVLLNNTRTIIFFGPIKQYRTGNPANAINRINPHYPFKAKDSAQVQTVTACKMANDILAPSLSPLPPRHRRGSATVHVSRLALPFLALQAPRSPA